MNRTRRSRSRRARRSGAVGRRLLVTVAALILIGGAEIVGMLSANAARRAPAQVPVTERAASPPHAVGELLLSSSSSAPSTARMAASRFVRDYMLWSNGRLAAIPARDATRRVIQLLERQDRGVVVRSRVVQSVRIAPDGADRFVVTSAVGNFLVGKRASHWLVVSLPGD